jgi:hypothetical protein
MLKKIKSFCCALMLLTMIIPSLGTAAAINLSEKEMILNGNETTPSVNPVYEEGLVLKSENLEKNTEETFPSSIDPVLVPSVSESVYELSVTGNVYMKAAVAPTGPYVAYMKRTYSNSVSEGIDYGWPSLVNAKAISVNTDTDGLKRFVLYYDNSIKYTVELAGRLSGPYDDTGNWPTLTNARSISFVEKSNSSYPYGRSLYRYVLYNDNTVKQRKVERSDYIPNISGPEEDVSAQFRSYDLPSVRSFAHNKEGESIFFLRSNNTITGDYDTSTDQSLFWPSMVNAKSIGFHNVFGSFNTKYVAYLDTNPVINVNNSNITVFKNSAPNTITLSGTVSDPDNDTVTISATVAGITKTTSVSNTSTARSWSLQWSAQTENIPSGSYSNIPITATSGAWGNAATSYSGSIIVNNIPNAPGSRSPGSSSSASPVLISGAGIGLNWAFADPDPYDVQTAYRVQLYNASGSSMVYDTDWIQSGAKSYTVPSGILNRGTIYSWRIAVKDNRGGTSNYSPLSYVKINSLPALTITSYTDGQQLADNILTFSWTYSDADAHTQKQYRIQGSKDNWATIGYDSGLLDGAAATLTTPALPVGTWSFKFQAYDGFEWSAAATRNNLSIPNSYEPNNTSAQAFGIMYNTEYSSVINTSSDVDIFKYTAPSTGIDRLTLSMPTDKNYDVFIYDANMNFVASGQSSGSGISEDTIYRTTASAVYYIKIVGFNGAYSNNPYTLKVQKYRVTNQVNYQYDTNGNIVGKTTTNP